MKLLEHHPDWKIPERRVKKFLKRHLSKHGDPSGADDDATITSMVSNNKSPGQRLRSLFKIKKNKTSSSNNNNNAPESAPPTIPMIDEEDESTPKKGQKTIQEEPTVEVQEPEAAPLDQTRSLDQVYSDDNDGKKNDCHCNEACAIM